MNDDTFEELCTLTADLIESNFEKNKTKMDAISGQISEKIAGIDMKDFLHGLSIALGNDIQMFLLSFSALYYATSEEACLGYIESELAKGKLDILRTCAIAFQTRSNYFRRGINKEYKKDRELNDIVAKQYFNGLNVQIPMIHYADRDHKLIVISTYMLLGETHAPTRWVITAVKYLQELGYEVMVVIEGYPFDIELIAQYWVGVMSIPNKIFPDGYFRVKMLGIEVPCYQVNTYEDDRDKLTSFFGDIYSMRPELVWKIGGMYCFDKIFESMTTYVTLACGRGYETGTGHLMLKCLETESDGEVEDFLHSLGQETARMQFREADFDEETKWHNSSLRSDNGIGEDDFVIAVVGNRLDQELTDNFWDVLKCVVKNCEDVRILLIGGYEKVIDDELFDKVINMGFCEELEEGLKQIDLFVNPKRGGGGTSAKLSIKAGKPVVTLPECDVAYVVGEEFVCNDYGEMKELCIKYVDDETFYKQMSEQAKENYVRKYSFDMKEEVRKVVEKAIEIGKRQ
ncbi:glycosyltransferase [Butyrivibrio sp. AD3002]|uniref:glycosyltransferase n=1 Tax=Butyrivibrio sp. AD3002 TaxID=1280670 RepID=UPI0003B5122C|nr:glycosyltransferase [Butyrivibrio sp. AD3002]